MVDPLCVAAFFDGRRGHEKQTRAVLQALERFTPLSVTTRSVDPENFFQAAGNWVCYGLRRIRPLKGSPSSVDLIIGAGSYTHIPMLLLKEETGARAVTCMAPDRFFLRRFDLCLIPRHDRPDTSDNIFVTLGPPCIRPVPQLRDHAKGLILVGGRDPKSHWWSSQNTMDQIRSILEADSLIHWTITSSPRTPPDMRVMLTQLAKDNPAVSFFKSEDTHLGWLRRPVCAELVRLGYPRTACPWSMEGGQRRMPGGNSSGSLSKSSTSFKPAWNFSLKTGMRCLMRCGGPGG